ncbi:TPA: hypothetical protein I7241_01650 [Vibrio vulnificus]|nr:hypothetical protein [Vibrio sp. 05-20-BW147]HAS6346661.1 hypothetical protein [Vibrio vulnificus]
MNLLSPDEAIGLLTALVVFAGIYGYVHVKYIRHHRIHIKFLDTLWGLMKNTIHGEHIRTLGYKSENEHYKPKN